MVKRCPNDGCGYAGSLPVQDVRYQPKQNIVLRTHACPKCSKVILTKEEIINADRGRSTLR